MRKRRGAAIVVGGAVAKGAFAAGALEHVVEALEREGTPIRALVGTSSGSLNATVLAAGVRAGDPVAATATLARMWRDDAGLASVLSLDLASALRGGGISRPTRVLRMLEAACAEVAAHPSPGALAPVALRVVVAPLAGAPGPRTTFEHVERFADEDFEREARRARMFRAAAASAAFPYAFQAVPLDPLGPCLDGGVVDNTPIKHAIEGSPDIEAVYVIVAEPADLRLDPARAARLRGFSLAMRLAEMLVDERLVRDLAEAEAVNGWVAVLDRLEAAGEITARVRRDIVQGLYGGAGDLRRLEVVEIRPAAELPGNAFSGFVSRDLRASYLAAGREAAGRACAAAARAPRAPPAPRSNRGRRTRPRRAPRP